MTVETSKLCNSDTDDNMADIEMNGYRSDSLSSDSDMPPVKQVAVLASSKTFKKKKPRKEPIHIQRDIAEGRAFNNSFTGPYPDETDHLHNDKGPNPQFAIFRKKSQN